jgi:regulator of sigma E protease
MLFSVLKFIGIFLEVLLLFNFVIFFHELGHFLAAKWRGLVVEEFAIWFGKPIWRKKIGGVWFALNSIPFGGYVKLPQLANGDVEGSSEIDRTTIPVAAPKDKIIVAAAGPLFSFILACIFAVIVWQIGHPVREESGTTTVGVVLKDSPAEKAGIKEGDRIVSIDGVPVKRWIGQGNDAIMWRVVRSEGDTVPVVVMRDGKELTLHPAPTKPEKTILTRRKTREIGMMPATTPMVGKVAANSPAAEAGLKERDLITHVNGTPLYSFSGIADFIADHPDVALKLTVERKSESGTEKLELPFKPKRPIVGRVEADSPAARAGMKEKDVVVSVDGKPMKSSTDLLEYVQSRKGEVMKFTVERGGAVQPELTVTPAQAKVTKELTRMRIGVGFDDDFGITFDDYGRGVTRHPGPWEQVEQSAMAIFNTLGAVTSSKSDISIQHLGGPVMMMRVYYLLFEQEDGWKLALWFSVVLNVNLALMNLLPIPPLDGSHITFATIAAIKGRPEAADEIANSKPVQWFVTGGTMMILGFMLFVTFYDLQDVFGGGGSKKFPYADKARAEANY